MAAGHHSSSEVTIALDDSGGTPRTLTSYIMTMGALKITSNTQPSTAYGDSWEKILLTGVRKGEAIELGGFFDDTATSGPHVVCQVDSSPQASTRTLTVVVGNSVTFSCEGYVTEYAVMGKVGSLTDFQAKYVPSGTVTWA